MKAEHMMLALQIVGGLLGALLVLGIILQLPGKNRFVDVAGSDHIEKLRKKLDGGWDPNTKGSMGISALSAAVSAKKIESVRLLLDRGADPNLKSLAGTPLQEAVDAGDLEIIELLLDCGADPSALGLFNRPAILEAIEKPSVPLTKAMLARQAAASRSAFLGMPVLLWAVSKAVSTKSESEEAELIDIIQTLVAHGANVNERGKDTPPAVVMALDKPRVLRVLVDLGAITDVAVEGEEYLSAIEEALRQA